MRKLFLFFALQVFCAASFLYAESAWLSSLPKADRSKASSLYDSVALSGKRIREAVEGERRAEAQYARKARSLAADFDRSPSADLASALSDQRRLRWEAARDLAEGKSGRPSAAGFESISALEARAEKDGAALAAILAKHLPKMGKVAQSALSSDLEKLAAAHPDCPASLFSQLRSAASSLSLENRRLWILSLTSALPRPVIAAFSGRGQLPEAFSAAFERCRKAYETGGVLKAALPAAAAAVWLADEPSAAVPAFALASLTSFLPSLASAESPSVAQSLAAYPDLDAAFRECLAVVWTAYRSDGAAFTAKLALDRETIERALRTAWAATGNDGAAPGYSSAAASTAPLDIGAVRAAERMAAYAESKASDAEILAAFAVLRSDASALRAFSSGVRYEAPRSRVSAAFEAALSAADKAVAAAFPRAVRNTVPSAETSVGGAPQSGIPTAFAQYLVVSYSSADGKLLRPDQTGPVFASAFAKALGWRGETKKKEEAAAWLEERGVLCSLPVLASASLPSAAEADLLSSARAFYPTENASRQRLALQRQRMSSEAARLGVPLRFAGEADASGLRLGSFLCGAARYAELIRARAMP